MTQIILSKIKKLREWEHLGLITTTGNTSDKGLSEFLQSLEKEVEELEVPVAGVTDEEIKAFLRETYRIIRREELATITEIVKNSFAHFSKLSVTGSKPLKTEGESETKLMNTAREFGISFTRPSDFAFGWRKCFEWMQESTPIDTLDKELFDPQICSICKINIDAIPTVAVDKEALLKQAKGEAERRNPYEKHMVDWNNGMHEGFIDGAEWVIEEYLRLCTGGGEKE